MPHLFAWMVLDDFVWHTPCNDKFQSFKIFNCTR